MSIPLLRGKSVCLFVSSIQLLYAIKIESSITYNLENLKGHSALITCSFDVREKPETLTFNKNAKPVFTCDLKANYICSGKDQRFTVMYGKQGQVSFSIKNLQCFDEGNYTCQIRQAVFHNSVYNNSNKSISVLDLKDKDCARTSTLSPATREVTGNQSRWNSSSSSTTEVHKTTTSSTPVLDIEKLMNKAESMRIGLVVNITIFALMTILLVLGGSKLISIYKDSLCNRRNKEQPTEPVANETMEINNTDLQPVDSELSAARCEDVQAEINESTALNPIDFQPVDNPLYELPRPIYEDHVYEFLLE